MALIGSFLVVTPLVAGSLSGVLSRTDTRTDSWFTKLRQPAWAPPSWVFGPVWTALYIGMGVASLFVWRATGSLSSPPLVLYWVQLALNLCWTPVFFGLHAVRLALAIIVLMLCLVIATSVAFWRQDTVAGALMVPYVAWVTFATALNAAIAALNVTLTAPEKPIQQGLLL